MSDPKRKKKVPPKKAIPHPDVGKKVWMTCRGSRPCGHNQAEIRLKARNPGGGWNVRYRCCGCGSAFSVST